MGSALKKELSQDDSKSIPNWIGLGRPRKKKSARGDLPAHYQFARWDFDPDGNRYAVPVGGIAKDKRKSFPLISTTIKNESTGTETLLWLHIDLDYKRADDRWKHNGRLDWVTIASCLKEETPKLFEYITAVTISSGGRGLSIAIAISPLELTPSTFEVQKLAHKVQWSVIQVLNFYGMGADPGARGLKRLMPNLFVEERSVDRATFVESFVQVKRPRVLQQILYSLRFHATFKHAKKRDRTDILWPDSRLEQPLAQLYLDILDNAGPWGSIQMTANELIVRYSIAKNSAYKILKNPPSWLDVKSIPGEGFKMQIKPRRILTIRAYEVIDLKLSERPSQFPSFHTASIPDPSKIEQGQRNQWIVSVVLACKWKGIDRGQVLTCLKDVVKKVVNWQRSQSLTRNLGSIVRSLYGHRPQTLGSNPNIEVPNWLEAALISSRPKRLSQKKPKKGACAHGLLVLDMASCSFQVASGCDRFFSPARDSDRPVGYWGVLGHQFERGTDYEHVLNVETRESEIASTEPSLKSSYIHICEELEAFPLKRLHSDFGRWIANSDLPSAEKLRLVTWAIDPTVRVEVRERKIVEYLAQSEEIRSRMDKGKERL